MSVELKDMLRYQYSDIACIHLFQTQSQTSLTYSQHSTHSQMSHDQRFDRGKLHNSNVYYNYYSILLTFLFSYFHIHVHVDEEVRNCDM